MQFEHKGIYSVLLNLDFGVKLPVSIIHVSLRLYSHLLVNNREWFVSLDVLEHFVSTSQIFEMDTFFW